MKEGTRDWVWAVVVAVVVASIMALPVPAGNEAIYLPLLAKASNSQYLPNDWTFGSGFSEQVVFDVFFAPLVDLFGLETVAWLGRLASWLLIARLLIALGRRLLAPPWVTAVSAAVLLGINQSMGVGSEFLFSHFEAKSVAWPLFLASLVAGLDKRTSMAAFLAGLTFTFHAAIGLWAGGALIGSMLIDRETRVGLARALPLAVIAGLPGLFAVGPSFLTSGMDASVAEFVALRRIAHHVDPFSFGERGPLILLGMLTFNFAWSWSNRHLYVPRLLGFFQVILLIGTLAGVLARVAGHFGFLLLQPFRVLPVLAPVIFLLSFSGMIIDRDWSGTRWRTFTSDRVSALLVGIGGATLLGVIVLWNPIIHLAKDIGENVETWSAPPTSLERMLTWASTGLEPDAVMVTPPWVDRMFYVTERAQLVSWGAVTFDRADEWMERLGLSMADVATLYGEWDQETLLADYSSVDWAHWLELARTHGVTHVVTTADYPATPIHVDGPWRIYELVDTPEASLRSHGHWL